MHKSISVMTFAGMTTAMVASVRNLTVVASTGWTMFFYMMVAALCYCLPIALISGEFASLFPDAGGPELWATNAFGKKWGFVAAFLLWAQMFPGQVLGGSVLAPLLGEALGLPELGASHIAIFLCTIIVYWLIIIICIHFDAARAVGKIGVWIGLYIPVAVIAVLGTASFIKSYLFDMQSFSQSLLGMFSAEKLVPRGANFSSMQYFTSILFIFAGIELSSVYIPRLDKPEKHYLPGIFFALIFTFAFCVVCGFLIAAAIPAGKMQLNNIAEPVEYFCRNLGLPGVITNLFAALVFIGISVQMTAWAMGPSTAITVSARRGMYPHSWRFWKTNANHVSVAVLVTQGVVVSALSLVFVLVPDANAAFMLLIDASCIIFNMVYLIMLAGIVYLRFKLPDARRLFRVGQRGNAALFVCCAVLLLTITGGVTATLVAESSRDALTVIGISAVFFIIPLLILYVPRTPLHKTLKI
jgi:amino acid transporter